METVTSRDGTTIAVERAGEGPAVVLVGGGLDDGSENAPLVPALAQSFTVLNYARRGRAGSTDAAPPVARGQVGGRDAVAREIEDLAAVITAAGGTAHVFGASSGGALALEAAAAGLPVGRIAVYEVPYLIEPAIVAAFAEYAVELHRLLGAGEGGAAVELFMRLAGSEDDDVAAARSAPVWPALEALAPTLAYDAACLGDGRPPVARLATVTGALLVLTGDGGGLFEPAAEAIAAAAPAARRHVLAGQGHVADPAALVPVLTRFFSG
ncbi:alpha/beta fold hydrolase [Dactylosporangium sp. AC04546]|uniref:alpha/beta fold hydrolase n=1 Tax=Dactylosporangium sp. AC04546 TaxID=2862460 RepID=UPI001EDF1583|nr:alpha/beta fold hydrolase [Dactylosporangium sp. AC04546]WVK88588.1 alpha/beta fold hydrolase [Dactylosporangium sp. AC04546]